MRHHSDGHEFRIVLEKPLGDRPEVMKNLYLTSLDLLAKTQFPGGGVPAGPDGTRYAGDVYPRDHAYATRAFLKNGMEGSAKHALVYILTADLSPDKVMYQRYDKDQKSDTTRHPQVDGNAQTLISLAEYTRTTGDSELAERFRDRVFDLVEGMENHTEEFYKGMLVYSHNGIIEFSPFEEGYELYTNAVTYRGFLEAAWIAETVYNDEPVSYILREKARHIKQGIAKYLYIPEFGGFMACVRKEPNPSVVDMANLKAFLALINYNVFTTDDYRIISSLHFHLEGTRNRELGGFARFSEGEGRTNLGNGPWPAAMLRLAAYYAKLANSLAIKTNGHPHMNHTKSHPGITHHHKHHKGTVLAQYHPVHTLAPVSVPIAEDHIPPEILKQSLSVSQKTEEGRSIAYLQAREQCRYCMDWVLNVARTNTDVAYGIPEHVVTRRRLYREYHGFMRTYDLSQREGRKIEYERNLASNMMKEHDVAYPVNPLIRSHAVYLLVHDTIHQVLEGKETATGQHE